MTPDAQTVPQEKFAESEFSHSARKNLTPGQSMALTGAAIWGASAVLCPVRRVDWQLLQGAF